MVAEVITGESLSMVAEVVTGESLSTVFSRSALGVASSSTLAPSSPVKVPSSSMVAPSSPVEIPSSSTVAPSLPVEISSTYPDIPSSSMVAPRSAPGVVSLSLVALRSASGVVSSSMAVPSLISSVVSDSLSVKECGRDVEGTSLSLVMPSSTEPCCDEVGFSSLDGEFAREQLSLMVRKMELADGHQSWSEIVESVIFAEVGTLTGSEAEDRVSASLIEEGTEFLFDEHGTNLVAEPGVGGSRPSLKTPPVLSSSSLVKKTMLETIREHEQMQLANSFLARESSSETTSSSDGSSYSSSHSEESADSADVANESDNVVGDDGRDDDVENVDVENDGVLGGAGDEQNGTGDVDVDEESEQDEFASDGDRAAVGDDDVGDRDGVDRRSNFSDEHDDFSDEQSGVSGSLEIIVVADGRDDADGSSDRRADVTDILRKIKQESLAASLAGSLDAFGDPCDYVKKKVRKARERPRSFIGPLVSHPDPSESFPSIVSEDTVKWILANCCRNGVIEARIPGEDERPWTVPDGWLCVYDFWFTEYHLWFPLPRLLLAYCDEHLIALAQLTPAAIRNIVAALFTAADIGVHMSLCLFERIAHITRCDKTDGAFYVSMKAGCGVVGERKRKTLCWIKKFFYVRIASSSVPDVSDKSVPFRSSWNPYNGRRLVGVPLAPGDSECVEYFKETKARDWTVVRRSEVWRRIPFIDSACWRKMDLSEIPSLVDCFAGGSDDAPVVESGQCIAGVEPSAPARSIVVGLTSTTVPVPSAGVSGKEVVAAGGEKVVKKRVAAGHSPKNVPPSKSRKVVSSDVEPSLVVESPAAEKAAFEPFEHSFNGLSSGCGDLFKLFQSPGGVDGLPFDHGRRGEWYQEFARHLAVATKFANKLVVNQDEELEEVKAELEKTKAELASIEGKADSSEEIAALRGKYEAEKKVSSDALEEVQRLTAKIALETGRVKKRQVADLERFKKEKEVAGRRYRRAVTRHDDVLATFNSRMEKVRRYVENQKAVRTSMYGVNQIVGVLDAAKTWKKEAIIIPDGKVRHLENELVRRKEKANLVVRVEFEPKELADIPSFDFTRPLSPVHMTLTAGVEDAAKARGKEENRRREEASRRRVAERDGAVSSDVRREGQVPSRP
ncbi:meiosis-specific protein ASY2 [Brassica napus]|nr:meiosis-specific protein ASY2 [Brassica napus]